MHDLTVIDDHRHAARIGLRQLVFLGEPPRHCLGLYPLMSKRHLAAPAERAETPIRLGTGEIVKNDRHK